MLRRCDSTVFSLRKSSAAISRLVMRSVTRSAISRSRLVSEAIAGSRRAAGPRASAPRAELAQLAAHLVAHAQRAAGVELALGLAQLGDRLLALAGAGQRLARAAARANAACSRAPAAVAPSTPTLAGGDRRLRVARGRAGPPRAPRPARPPAGCRPSRLAASASARSHVRFGRLDVADRELRQSATISQSKQRSTGTCELDPLAAERLHRLVGPLGLARLEQGDRQRPAGTAARRRASCPPVSRSPSRALSSQAAIASLEIAGEVARPGRARTAPRRGSGGCAESRAASTAASQTSAASASSALQLERVALDQHQRDEQPPLAGARAIAMPRSTWAIASS